MHQEILDKKRARLAKYTGRKLKLKRAAYEKALNKLNGLRVQTRKEDCPPTLKTGNTAFTPNTPKPTIETGDPEWTVVVPDGKPFRVRATTEKKARAEARKTLKLRALPAGTTVEKA